MFEGASFSMMVIPLIGLGLAIIVLAKSRRIGPALGVIMLTFLIMTLSSSSVLRFLADGFGDVAGVTADEFEGESESSATPSPPGKATPSSEATPAPSPSETSSPVPQAPESTTNWGDVWMVVGLIAASLVALVLVAWLAVTFVRRSKVRHREYVEAREKARTEKARHEALLAQIAKAWAEATKKHDDLDAEYLSYQKDLKKIARYPLMTDLAVPLTKKAVRAMTEARNRRPSVAPEEMEGVDRYREAVTSFELALRAAISNAKREGLKNFSEKEQKDLERAQDQLRLAEDKGGSPHERRSAYERAIKTLQGILGEVPQEALLEIETRAKEDGIALALSS